MPTQNAPHVSITSAPQVTLTAPARIPLVIPWKSKSTFSFEGHNIGLRKKVTIPAIEGAIMVLAMIISAAAPYSPVIPPDEAPLKRSQPSQRMRVPSATFCGECAVDTSW